MEQYGKKYSRLSQLKSFPADHPHEENETLLNPSPLRAVGHYMSDAEIENGCLQSVILNYECEWKKDNPNFLIIPLTAFVENSRENQVS